MQQREEHAAGAEQEGDSPSRDMSALHVAVLDGGLFGGDQTAQPLWSSATLPQQQMVATAQRHLARAPGSEQRMPDSTTNNVSQPAAMTAGVRQQPAASQGAGPAAVGRRGSGGEVSGSIVRSVFDAVRSGFTAMGRALLPPSLHKLLDGESALEQPLLPWYILCTVQCTTPLGTHVS